MNLFFIFKCILLVRKSVHEIREVLMTSVSSLFLVFKGSMEEILIHTLFAYENN